MADFGQINLCDRDKADPIRFEDLPDGEFFITFHDSERDSSVWDVYIKTHLLKHSNQFAGVFNAVLLNKAVLLKQRSPDDLVYRVEVTDITIKPDW